LGTRNKNPWLPTTTTVFYSSTASESQCKLQALEKGTENCRLKVSVYNFSNYFQK